MADGFTVRIDKASYDEWQQYVSSHLQYRVNGALGKEGDAAAKWIAATYLHGKAMNRITGTTIAHFGVRWSRRYKAYLLAPGYKIRGNQNYLARYVGTKHEFVRPGFEAYFGSHNITETLEQVIRKTMEEMR
jgi:hypothetical protein